MLVKKRARLVVPFSFSFFLISKSVGFCLFKMRESKEAGVTELDKRDRSVTQNFMTEEAAAGDFLKPLLASRGVGVFREGK